MSDDEPCGACGFPGAKCGAPYDPSGQLCCPDCDHVYDYGAMLKMPMSDATIAALGARLASGDYPVRLVPDTASDVPVDRVARVLTNPGLPAGGIRVRPPTPSLADAVRRVTAYLDERGPDRPNVIKTAGPRHARYAKPRLRADDLRALLDAARDGAPDDR